MDKHSELIKKRYNRAAKYFDLSGKMMEKGKMGKWREMIWTQTRGRVLEVGVGTGKNIEYYPENVEVTAIDFSENMLARARDRARRLNKKVTLLQMDVEALDFPDDTFDTVVTTCVFCSVPDPVKGLQEIRRVLKKDGRFIMLEHVRSENPVIGTFMDFLNPLVVRIVGANINRDTVENLRKAGLNVQVEQDLMMDIVKHLGCRKF